MGREDEAKRKTDRVNTFGLADMGRSRLRPYIFCGEVVARFDIFVMAAGVAYLSAT
jgi:hypothetical protein